MIAQMMRTPHSFQVKSGNSNPGGAMSIRRPQLSNMYLIQQNPAVFRAFKSHQIHYTGILFTLYGTAIYPRDNILLQNHRSLDANALRQLLTARLHTFVTSISGTVTPENPGLQSCSQLISCLTLGLPRWRRVVSAIGSTLYTSICLACWRHCTTAKTRIMAMAPTQPHIVTFTQTS